MKRGLISYILVTALLASIIFGALGASCRFASASAPSDPGYISDLLDEAREYCPVSYLTQFDLISAQLIDNFENLLVVVMHSSNKQNWYFSSYVPKSGSTVQSWGYRNRSYSVFQPRYENDNSGNYNFYSRYGMNFSSSTFASEPYNVGLGNTSFGFNPLGRASWYYYVPNPDDVNGSNYVCYSNHDLTAYNGYSEPVYFFENLLPGSSVPPITDIYLKAFWLGERRYLTLTDQALVRGLDPDKNDSTWYFFNNEDQDYGLYDWRIITWDNILLIPGGENFVSGLTNVSPLGVYAYDITDLWWSEIVSSYLEDDEGNIFAVALNTPFVIQEEAPEPGTDGQPSSETVIYQYINNYVSNYPSVTIVPQELASQLAGTTAYTSGTGFLTIPDQLIQYAYGYDQDYSGEFRYDLSQSGLDPDEFSMINFNLLNVVVVPGRLDVDYFYLDYWDSSVVPTFSDWQGVNRYTISQNLIDKYNYTNDLFESFDLVIFAPLNVLQDTGTPYDGSKDRNTGYIGDIGRYDSLDPDNRSPMFWILTRSAIEKSQLFIFCDGFSKLYDLATQVCIKRDLWDSSFFEWSMSIFYQLQTIGGSLNGIKATIDSWGLSENYFLTLSQKLDNIVTNTRLDDPGVWYLPLWNFIKQFEPAVEQFSDAVNVFDDTWDDLPLLPEPSNAPAIPTLPGYEIRYLS